LWSRGNAGIGLPFHKKTPEHEEIHLRAEKTIERFFGAADNGFVLVERGIEHERDAREFMEGSY
jgi:hypothetical protein